MFHPHPSQCGYLTRPFPSALPVKEKTFLLRSVRVLVSNFVGAVQHLQLTLLQRRCDLIFGIRFGVKGIPLHYIIVLFTTGT
jgi:hypothetical protein